ncbi:MAG: hypothetical protein ACRDY7_03255, partial [Acidimicrobiia bacterium]
VFDAAGRLRSRSAVTTENPGRDRPLGQEIRAGSCHSEGARPGFDPLPIREAIHHGSNDFAHAQFFPYRQRGARYLGQEFKQQWLVCAFGGADANNGSRVTKAGPGIAYQDPKKTWKLGHAWKEGSTPTNTTISLSFQTAGPVQVHGGMSQTPTHHLKGSPRPPHGDDKMEAIQRNGAHGWWEHGCEPRCGGNGSVRGSSDYHGSVVEGLWEFPDTKRVHSDDFLLKVYWSHHCANVFGVCS